MKSTNYFIVFSYDGSKFFGYQKQKNKLTIQGNLEEVLSKLDNNQVQVVSSGRTDIGVHAISQSANFKLKRKFNPEKLKRILNKQLNNYIYVKKCIEIDNEFHSRFSAKEKIYVYKINLGEYNPLIEDYTLQLNKKLNIKKMKKASKYFIGEKNYENFVSGKRKNYVTKITKIKINKRKKIINIKITGKHFYQYMIRNIVGALIDVGIGKEEIKIIEMMLNTKTKKRLSTAYSKGLYLERVKY